MNSADDLKIKTGGARLLIVEGRDEQFFFEAALRDHLLLSDVQVMPIGGKTKLTRSLAILVKDALFPTIPSIAVGRDADETVPGAKAPSAVQPFQSICGSLRHVNLPHPPAHG